LRSGEFKFRTPREARALSGLLAQCTVNPTTVVTGLWELLINAIEHGNLGISYAEKSALLASGLWQEEIAKRLAEPQHVEKYASVQVELTSQQVIYTVVDQGQGFDPRPYFEFEPGRATHAHGRGIAMARRLSFTSVEYLNSRS
jgi:anti-sigma regulatory factor (Ser/Thr protein kinase)